MNYVDVLTKANAGDQEAILIVCNDINENTLDKIADEDFVKYVKETKELTYSAYIMGMMHELGKDVKKDFKESNSYYKKSAGLGNSSAWFRLGKVYELRDETDVKAAYYYKRGTKVKNTDCMNNLAWMYIEGRGVSEDREKGIELFKQAAELNSHDAIGNLALLYMSGKGVQMNYAKAIELFEKAGEMGNAVALNNLGWIYQHGKTVKKDHDKAIEYYNRSIEKGGPMAMYNLARMHQNGIGMDTNEKKAMELYEKSYLLNFDKAIDGLLELHEKNNTLIELCTLCLRKNDKKNFKKIFGKVMKKPDHKTRDLTILIFDKEFDEMYNSKPPFVIVLLRTVLQENIRLHDLYSDDE